MVVTQQFIEENYPLHNLIWQKRHEDLDSLITHSPEPLDIEKLDPRGNTPLFLAVRLGLVEAVRVLLKHSANTSFEHCSGWTVVHEAICTGDPELLGVILQHRTQQRRVKRSEIIPNLLRRLKDAPDFYVEMKWEFTSWVPLVTRMCPANTHRVYKMGSSLRVDSSDGLDEQNWSNGAISVIFQGTDDGVKMMEIDHASSQVFSSTILTGDKANSVPDNSTYEKTISQRLSNPAIISTVNLEKIAFERNKTGIWGWGIDKSERVNNYDCKVFAATNVELVTKMRYEHLPEADKSRSSNSGMSISNLQKVLNTFGSDEPEEKGHDASPLVGATGTTITRTKTSSTDSPTAQWDPYARLSPLQYFDKDEDLNGQDIGRPKEVKAKVNKFKATVWLSEEYPLNLQEQLMPIVDIMALSSSQFSKLKDFITMQIPAGFPLKIEIPLFHLVNACITFHNIFSMESPVSGVSYLLEESGRLSCILEEELFQPPPHYAIRSSDFGPSMNPTSSADDLFQWTTTGDEGESPEAMDIYQALNAPRTRAMNANGSAGGGFFNPDSSDAEEQFLQRAIEESLKTAQEQSQDMGRIEGLDSTTGGVGNPIGLTESESMEQLQKVLEMSRREIENEARLRREEEEALKMVLELSLHDK